jgi:hypothetical protein
MTTDGPHTDCGGHWTDVEGRLRVAHGENARLRSELAAVPAAHDAVLAGVCSALPQDDRRGRVGVPLAVQGLVGCSGTQAAPGGRPRPRLRVRSTRIRGAAARLTRLGGVRNRLPAAARSGPRRHRLAVMTSSRP